MFWQKHKIRESIPEEILGGKCKSDLESSQSTSSESCATQISNPKFRKKKLNWVINMIVEAIEQTVVCEPVTLKLKTSKVRSDAVALF